MFDSIRTVLVILLPILFRFALYVPVTAEATKRFRGIPGSIEPLRPVVLAAIRVAMGLVIAGLLFLIVKATMSGSGSNSPSAWEVFIRHGLLILLPERIIAWFLLFKLFVVPRGEKVPWGTVALCTLLSFLIDLPTLLIGSVTGLAFLAQGMGSC